MATWKTRNCPLASLAGQASGCIDDRSIQQLGFSEGKALLKLVCRSSRQAEEEPRGRPGSLAVLLAPPWPPCSLPSLSRALLKVSILAALKDTVPNMPGLKWIFNPVLAKGEHAVKLTPEEESKRTADDDTDTVTDEQDTVDDELMDPRAVQALPEMAPGGGTKLTKFQKLQALSDDRAKLRKTFESAGGSSNKHFAIDCSLYHSTQRGGHRTTDGTVFCSSC